VLLNIFFL